ncbi:MAG TPA: hypothetical protein VLD83_12110 [Candidatus Binatia bacterium]|nr:hypothetical protein [Candidatus Binatia bacterium]
MTTISTTSNEGGLFITSNDGKLDSASSVLEVRATNPEYNQPVLRIKQLSKLGGAASIRIDDPNPDIEFVETGLTGPDPGAGKFEIAVQADRLQINGRKADNTGFETIVVFQRPAAGGNMGFGFKKAKDFKEFGGGQGVFVIANASVAPSPSKKLAGAGMLYVENGALMYMGSNGNVTVLAPA